MILPKIVTRVSPLALDKLERSNATDVQQWDHAVAKISNESQSCQSSTKLDYSHSSTAFYTTTADKKPDYDYRYSTPTGFDTTTADKKPRYSTPTGFYTTTADKSSEEQISEKTPSGDESGIFYCKADRAWVSLYKSADTGLETRRYFRVSKYGDIEAREQALMCGRDLADSAGQMQKGTVQDYWLHETISKRNLDYINGVPSRRRRSRRRKSSSSKNRELTEAEQAKQAAQAKKEHRNDGND
jgi:hypothetical protein